MGQFELWSCLIRSVIVVFFRGSFQRRMSGFLSEHNIVVDTTHKCCAFSFFLLRARAN